MGLTLKISFWLLDTNYASLKTGPEQWMWGIDSTGRRLLIVDRDFTNYFYAVIESDCDPNEVARNIRKEYNIDVLNVESANRHCFGKPVQVLKVYCKEIAEIAKKLRSFEGVKECLEYDIRSSMRYLIANNVEPCSWHEANVESTENIYGARVDKVFIAKARQKS
jgi:DNA polymerase, archaea type